MTKSEIRERALFYVGAEPGDGDEFAPHLDGAIEEGYGLLRAAAGLEWPERLGDGESPLLPEWAHSPIADFAAYMLLRIGGADRRQRASAHYARFHQAVSRMCMKEGQKVRFRNFY